ncbi:MAG: hypothetical protein ACREH5_01925 [Candidatus Omnitrophota bacterium]
MRRLISIGLAVLALTFFADAPAEAGDEKILDYTFENGVKINVHYTDTVLAVNGESGHFAREVLNAAVSAYQTISEFQGFSTKGFSFASPDKGYAYDPDRAIDVYLGHPEDAETARQYGVDPSIFKDAPCFDTKRVSKTGFHAMIFLPANYREFIRNWERVNASPLGERHIEVDLNGTLIHEMLHVALFYYNKNLNKDGGTGREGAAGGEKIDWYVEGLARYFETFAGARHDFFSQGFKITLPDKIRFSRGGANYFMRYPDQSFMELRYENALFWRFLDYRYGMDAIERLSRVFRSSARGGFRRALEKVTGERFPELLKRFAMSILLKDFGLKEDGVYLMNVAKTHLVYRDGSFFLAGARGEEARLGEACRTDWIGKWENAETTFENPAVAGDSTARSDVSAWATDFFEIGLDLARPSLPAAIGVTHEGKGKPLALQALILTAGGSQIPLEAAEVRSASTHWFKIRETLSVNHLGANDVDKIILLITNLDPRASAEYEILARP